VKAHNADDKGKWFEW